MHVVRLEDVPVRVFLESQDHQHDLIRELQLIEMGGRRDAPVGGAGVSAQLATLIGSILARYRDVRVATRNQALAALERGDETVTLEIPVQDGMPAALREWLALLEEAERLAARSELLLVPAPDDVRRLRQWYVARVLEGLPEGASR